MCQQLWAEFPDADAYNGAQAALPHGHLALTVAAWWAGAHTRGQRPPAPGLALAIRAPAGTATVLALCHAQAGPPQPWEQPCCAFLPPNMPPPLVLMCLLGEVSPQLLHLLPQLGDATLSLVQGATQLEVPLGREEGSC